MSRVLRALAVERAYSAVEMLTVMAIMAVVMGGLTTLFVQGSTAELDMNRRFQAQQEARVALDKIRREIHCAQSGATDPSTGAAAKVTLTLPGQCPSAVGAVQTDVSWCSVSVASGRWALYRKVGGTCDNTGIRWADYLTEANVFQYQGSSTTSLARLRVNIPVDVKPGDATPVYALCDQIVLRNSVRSGLGGPSLPACS